MPRSRRPGRIILRVEHLECRDVPAGGLETFNQAAIGTLPAGWVQWTSDGAPAFAVSTGRAVSGAQGLTTTSSLSTRTGLAWKDEVLPADTQVGADVYLDTLIPAGVFLRGTNLGTASPTFYAVTVTRGASVEVSRTVAGVRTTLATLNSTAYLSGQWVQLSLTAAGSTLQVSVLRLDTQQYLDPSGAWTTKKVSAITLQDTAIGGGGRDGIFRPGRYAGAATLDDFQVVVPQPADTVPPTVSFTTPVVGPTLSGPIQVSAVASDNVAVTSVQFLFNGQVRATVTGAPYIWVFDTRTVADGTYALEARALDAAGNIGIVRQTVVVNNTAPAGQQLQIPQHLPNIRVAMLAWAGTPFTSFEQNLLQSNVDLVVPNPSYLAQIDTVAPSTPQLIYTNLSNVYLDLLTDWLNYAERNGLNPENAFYHVTQPTPFTGGSPSSIPVDWLWSVRSDSQDFTSAAHDPTAGGVPFGAVAGQTLNLGYTDPFRELNFAVKSSAANGWSGTLEYVSATDAAGNPTAWKTLTLLDDSTNGLHQSGSLHFDPPADWKPASLGGGPALYYVRFRTVTGGTAPVASTILGNNYLNEVSANGTFTGTIPVFDTAADLNHDGYLSDAEYAHRAPGDNARFLYQSRLVYFAYGPERYAINPAGVGVRAWAIDYETRFLAANPLADGLFVDNSSGTSPTAGFSVAEPSANYTADYAALLAAVKQAVAPHWLMANTAGLYSQSDPIISQVSANWQEFGLRPMTSTWAAFEDMATLVAHRQGLTNPSPYTILDTLPDGSSPTDPRTEIAALAYYYLVGNAQTTFFMYNGGNSPASSWTQHWFNAIQYNVGQPSGTWSVLATGPDPSNPALTYKTYQRNYTNALVLYKPLSYKLGVGTGTSADNTATTQQLSGTYRLLQADGTLGPPVTSVTLRNGEGAILIKS